MRTWISPLLNIRFDLKEDDLHVFDSDGKEFMTHTDYDRQLRMANKMTDAERLRAESAVKLAKKERLRAKEAVKQAEKMAAKLRELGISPDQL